MKNRKRSVAGARISANLASNGTNIKRRDSTGANLKRRGSGNVSAPIPENKPKKTPSAARSEKKEEKASSCNGIETKTKEIKGKSEEKSEEGEANRMGRIKVLVAEDNKINQKVLKRTLMRVGIKEEIDIVENGQLAVEASEEKFYDIIFMDMQMPVMDGLEATSIISKRAIHPKIVFLTAHALSEYQEKAIEAGGDCFISKPFKLDAIRSIIQQLVLEEEEESEEEL